MSLHLKFRHNIQQTPRSAARQSERDERQLDSPVHRRIPQQTDLPPPPILPLNLPFVNQIQVPPYQGGDPFVTPPTSSPAAARLALDDLRAQAAATSAILLQTGRRRQHGRAPRRAPAQDPLPALTPAPTPSTPHLLRYQVVYFTSIESFG